MNDKPLDCVGLSAMSQAMVGKSDYRFYVSLPDVEILEKRFGKLWVEQNCRVAKPLNHTP